MISGKDVRFEVFTTVGMMMLIFWVFAPCRLVGRCQCLGGTHCLHLQGKTVLEWELGYPRSVVCLVRRYVIEVIVPSDSMATGFMLNS
jgi:hypothetical protein